MLLKNHCQKDVSTLLSVDSVKKIVQNLSTHLITWEQAGFVPYPKTNGGDLGFVLKDPDQTNENHNLTQYVKIYSADNTTPIVQAIYSSLQHKKNEDVQCWFELSPDGKTIFLISPEVKRGINVNLSNSAQPDMSPEMSSDDLSQTKQEEKYEETPGSVRQAMSSRETSMNPEYDTWQELDNETKKACYKKLLSHCLEAWLLGIKDVRKENIIGDTNIDIIGVTEVAYRNYITGMDNRGECEKFEVIIPFMEKMIGLQNDRGPNSIEENLSCLWDANTKQPNGLAAKIMLYYIYTQHSIDNEPELHQQILWAPQEVLYSTNFQEMLGYLDDYTAAEVAKQTIEDVRQRLLESGKKIPWKEPTKQYYPHDIIKEIMEDATKTKTAMTPQNVVDNSHKKSLAPSKAKESLVDIKKSDEELEALAKIERECKELENFREYLGGIKTIARQIHDSVAKTYHAFAKVIAKECIQILSSPKPPSPKITLQPNATQPPAPMITMPNKTRNIRFFSAP